MSLTSATHDHERDTWAVVEDTMQRISLFAARLIVVSVTAVSGLILLLIFLTSSTVAQVTKVEGFEVTSGSMSPVFEPGAVVLSHLLSKQEARNMNVGDIVTFKSASDSSFLITHRIVEVQNAGTDGVFYTTKGDANQSVDLTHLAPSQIVGKYRTSIPLVGHLIESMHRVQVILIFTAALVFAYISMMTSQKILNNKEKQQ